MPVVALPASNTARIYIDYSVGGEDHTLIARFMGISSSPALVLSTLAEVFAFLSPALFLTTIIGARQSFSGSDVTNPIAWPGSPSYGAGTPPDGQQMKFVTMVGKSADGHRCRYAFFGVTTVIPPTWRVSLLTAPDLADAFDHIQSAHNNSTLSTISGQRGLFNRYFNIKYFDHEIAKVRG